MQLLVLLRPLTTVNMADRSGTTILHTQQPSQEWLNLDKKYGGFGSPHYSPVPRPRRRKMRHIQATISDLHRADPSTPALQKTTCRKMSIERPEITGSLGAAARTSDVGLPLTTCAHSPIPLATIATHSHRDDKAESIIAQLYSTSANG